MAAMVDGATAVQHNANMRRLIVSMVEDYLTIGEATESGADYREIASRMQELADTAAMAARVAKAAAIASDQDRADSMGRMMRGFVREGGAVKRVRHG